jgi:hypothetical protein
VYQGVSRYELKLHDPVPQSELCQVIRHLAFDLDARVHCPDMQCAEQARYSGGRYVVQVHYRSVELMMLYQIPAV